MNIILNGLKDFANEFLQLSFASGKWKKWMIEGNKTTDRDKALIAGHYNFSKPKFVEIKNKAEIILLKKGINLNLILKESIKRAVYRYLKNFRLVF